MLQDMKEASTEIFEKLLDDILDSLLKQISFQILTLKKYRPYYTMGK